MGGLIEERQTLAKPEQTPPRFAALPGLFLRDGALPRGTTPLSAILVKPKGETSHVASSREFRLLFSSLVLTNLKTVTLLNNLISFPFIKKHIGRATYGFPSNITVYDPEGVPLKLGLVDGKLVPPFGEKFIKKIRDMSLRDDDIILCGYPKTGCHWTWEVLSMIVKGQAETSKQGKTSGFLEMMPMELIDSVPSPRILNTHMWFNDLPKQMAEKKTKLVFTTRNPKDTAVSFYNHHVTLDQMHGYDGKFKNWFELLMDGKVDYGSYFDYHVEWDKDIREHPDQPILVLSFEDMKEDLPREIRKMCQFLDVSLEDQLIEDIARAAGFDAMKKKLGEEGSISHKILRKGQVGDWKNWLTVAQDERVDAAKEKLKDTRFKKMRDTIE